MIGKRATLSRSQQGMIRLVRSYVEPLKELLSDAESKFLPQVTARGVL
jgi:hypothetical protein